MQSKCTTNHKNSQQLPAGVALNDHNIEFIGQPSNKTVIWMQRGHSHSFENLPKPIYKALEELFFTDDEAIVWLTRQFQEHAHDEKRLVELYTYYMYGDFDHSADVIDGVLQPSENFRETKDCISMNFLHKTIDVNGMMLCPRSISILDDMSEGVPDKMIAHKLGIAQSTYDFHKRELYKKLNVQSKPEAVAVAFRNKILCAS